MDRKIKVILPLATALAAFAASGDPAAASVTTDHLPTTPETQGAAAKIAVTPNASYAVGDDLLGLLVSKNVDGTVVAEHASHMSHASHASHASSRY